MRIASLVSRRIRDFRSLPADSASGEHIAATRAQAEVLGDTPWVDESLRHYPERRRLAA